MKMQDGLQDGVVVIRLSGKIMGGNDGTMFHGRVHEYLGLNKRNFVIDMDKVIWSNSTGLGMLVSAWTSIKRAEGRMVLANITSIQTLLTMTQLLRVFECYDSVKEAIAALTETTAAEH
jgi:anti-sigma B factor antagonist